MQNGDQQGLEYANVLLGKAADSSLIKNMLSGSEGAFLFEGIAPGNYRVLANMIGLGKAASIIRTRIGR